MYSQIIVWLIVLEILGLLGFLISFRAFSRLSDRGYCFSKPVGLLLISILTWFLGLTHVLPNMLVSVLVALIILLVLSFSSIRNHTSEFLEYVGKNLKTILIFELLFIIVFVIFAISRSLSPDLNHTEQPMDLMLLNAVITSPSYPPQDPWLSGEVVSYYYFGYLMFGVLANLAWQAPQVAYNLGIATVAALSAVTVFGIVFNLIRISYGSWLGAIFGALAGVFFLVFASNLVGTLELLRSSGIGSEGFWEFWGVQGLTATSQPSHSWRPDDSLWWWWRASRVVPGTINEFPMFSFLLGDLHPHVMSIPFVLLVVGIGLQIYQTPKLINTVSLAQVRLITFPAVTIIFLIGAALVLINWPANLFDWAQNVLVVGGAFFIILLISLTALATLVGLVTWSPNAIGNLGWPFSIIAISAIGSLAAINLWDLPLGIAIITGAVLLNLARFGSNIKQRLGRGLVLIWLTIAMSAIVFIPYYLTLETTGSGIAALRDVVSRPAHLFLVWGVFITLSIGFLIALIPRFLTYQGAWVTKIGVSSFFIFTPLLIWFQWGARLFTATVLVLFVIMVIFAIRRAGYRLLGADEVNFAGTGTGLTLIVGGFVIAGGMLWDGIMNGERIEGQTEPAFARLLIVLPIAILSLISCYGSWVGAEARALKGRNNLNAVTIVLALMALSLIVLMGAELFYVSDFFGGDLRRMNTVFKFYYQIWILLSVVAGFSIWYVSSRWNTRILRGRVGLLCWSFFLVTIFGSLSYYPMASLLVSHSYASVRTLDGQNYIARENINESMVIDWIRKNVRSEAVVLEAAEIPCANSQGFCSDWTSVGRIAGNTGRPTVIGWEQHELQWRKKDEVVTGRRDDVRVIYETIHISVAETLLEKYQVDYVLIGPRERAAYGIKGRSKFFDLGNPVYTAGESEKFEVFKINSDLWNS